MKKQFLNEAFSPEGEKIFTGEQIASMCGLGDLYRQGKQEETEMVENVKSKFSNLTERMNNVPKADKTVD